MVHFGWKLVMVGASLLLLQTTAQAEVVSKSVIASGGGKVVGGGYAITMTTGQSVVGTVSNIANVHEIGFWFRLLGATTGVADQQPGSIPVYRLGDARPNPMNPATTIMIVGSGSNQIVLKTPNAFEYKLLLISTGNYDTKGVITW